MKQQEQKSKEYIRRPRKVGEHYTKMVSFRCDIEVIEHLGEERNKGRLINDLLRKHYGI